MTALLTILTIVYGFGVIITSFVGIMDWSINRDMQREYREELQNPTEAFRRRLGETYAQKRYDEYQATITRAARRFVRAPLWPVDALAGLGRILTDAKADQP